MSRLENQQVVSQKAGDATVLAEGAESVTSSERTVPATVHCLC